jgi:hypothetical protein
MDEIAARVAYERTGAAHERTSTMKPSAFRSERRLAKVEAEVAPMAAGAPVHTRTAPLAGPGCAPAQGNASAAAASRAEIGGPCRVLNCPLGEQ